MCCNKIHIDLIAILVYKNDIVDNPEDQKLSYIPEYIKKILTDKYYSEIINLIKYDNFDEIYNDTFGGVGSGNNNLVHYRTKNNKYNLIEDDYEFSLNYHYDGSSYCISIEIDKKLTNDLEFMKIVNDIKKELNNLWSNDLRDSIELEFKKLIQHDFNRFIKT